MLVAETNAVEVDAVEFESSSLANSRSRSQTGWDGAGRRLKKRKPTNKKLEEKNPGSGIEGKVKSGVKR